MKLEVVKLKNFRGYGAEVTIPINDLTAFIGRNDAGKSTVFEALEIFFNNSIVKCEKDDLNINAENNLIEITCIFGELPEQLVIDSAFPTSLAEEHLLNSDQKLEIKKVYSATAANPKEKTYIICMHPTVTSASDLLTLKRTDLRSRANQIGVEQDAYNASINASIRQAIRANIEDLDLSHTELLVDKEDSKKVYDSIKSYLPLYALFQSDRPSKDDDKEVTDPMKIAVQQALAELSDEIEHIKNEVREKAIETANRTLAKLHEMSPDLADELIPEFKTEPKFDSQFKLSIKSENDISINKRGSGVRRLILLNFFRAEAERRRSVNEGSNIIFAFEEPETSQHPDHQRMLIEAFMELSNTPNSQVMLTTHTPSLAGLLPLESLRFIERNGQNRTIEMGSDEVFAKVADTLGLLPDPVSKYAKAMLLLEGKGDVTFVEHAAEKLKEAGHIQYTFEEKRFALVPIGGCGNLKHWRTLQLAEQFDIPYCVLLDSDKGTNEEQQNLDKVSEMRADGIKAYTTRKREPENYIHLDCLALPAGSQFSFTDMCDAKVMIGKKKGTRKTNVLEDYWIRMSAEQIREMESYQEDGEQKFEFTEMFNDFLELVE
ncbi:AAA family ATPase [Vibrio sp. ZSDZ65]|jgi:predicted ATP-dependent endonuclease of OLD family|uniref:AAA family ATPase n=1 Tax=Vibrio qingdaonensis TaxID=2829491 RepID=A0A9X3CLF6_9VIBR|nr:AAA family ATPase [Vibrio qingdaonensis]MCW8345475.1 AAA family ATPase [Vibrio qingdaonensis]